MTEARPKISKAARELAAVAFRQWSPRLQTYLVRKIHHGVDVPDLAMEIYERFLRARNLEVIENPRAFLFRIARNAMIDAHRLETTRSVIYDTELMAETGERLEVSVDDDAAERIDRANALQEVRVALKALPAVHQAVLWLAVYDGLSHREIAERTGLTVKTVGVYVSEARARLRILLKRQGR